MGICKYCSKPAGFFQKKHVACHQHYEVGKNEIISLYRTAVFGKSPSDDFLEKIKSVSKSHFISDIEMRGLIANEWCCSVEKALDNGLLSQDEEKKLENILDRFTLSQKDVDQGGTYTKFVQGSILRNVAEGKVPECMKIDGNLPFVFKNNEKLIWLSQHVKYYGQKVRREYVGGYQGLSIRIAKGIYYRTGRFRGNPVEKTEMAFLDTGLLGITNKNLYFSGASKCFCIPYGKIISMESFSDGIGIHRNAASAKPQVFILGDGWFIYNLLSNITKMG